MRATIGARFAHPGPDAFAFFNSLDIEMRYIPQTDERVDEPRMHADSDDTDHDPNEFGADPADILEHRELMDGVNLRGDVITGH